MIAPNRLEELLGGAVPEGEHEARVQGLVRELRVGSAPAPASLRACVAALADEKPRRRALLLRRRAALALALALAATAAVGAGLALRGGNAQDAAVLDEPAAAPKPVPAPRKSEGQRDDLSAGEVSSS